MSVPGWMAHGSCVEHPDLPWTTDTRDSPTSDVDLMSAICGACPVVASCWAFAAAEGITGGYWAGFDWDVIARQTQKARRSRAAA